MRPFIPTCRGRARFFASNRCGGRRGVAAVLRLLVRRARTMGRIFPEHAHWNWMNKLSEFDRDVHRLVGIECGAERCRALMA